METLEAYKILLASELKRRLGLEIGDTRLDDEDLVKNSFESGETVGELIDWLVEKDDLTEYSSLSFTY